MNRTYVKYLSELAFRCASGKLRKHELAIVNGVKFWRQKNKSVIIIPEDGSYVRIINPSWYA